MGAYFSERTFDRFHCDFEPAKHRLDCRVPSPGQFKCQQFAIPGTKKSKRKLKNYEPDVEQCKEEKESEGKDGEKIKKKPVKNGCGHSWHSNFCLTKFHCLIQEGNVLVVQLREYGQRCRHCQKRYENPSFEDGVLDIMLYWLLAMILEGELLNNSIT